MIRCLAILVACGLFFGSVYADEPKSFKITLRNAYKIGSTEFQPGDYKVAVDASKKVRFTEVKSGKAVDVEAKVESTESKFEHTSITSRTVDGVIRLTEIQIGGSKTKIAFQD